MNNIFTRGPMKRVLVFFLVAIICAVIAFVVISTKPADKETAGSVEASVKGMPVTVAGVEPEACPATITLLGEVVPLWQTSVKAQVDGKIVFLPERMQVGNLVKRGELLARSDKSGLEMQLAEAKSRLAAATVGLLKEEREFREAEKNWKQSGLKGRPSSPLVLRKPQLEAARAEVAAARAAVSHAEALLSYTDIRAPYDGVIMSRQVSPGDTLLAGDKVAVLYGLKAVEIGVHLNTEQWALLPQSVYEAKVKLMDPEQGAAWDAVVARESRHLSRESRLRTLYLQVKKPMAQSPPLLPGTFVQVQLTGKTIPDLLRIPESALTKQGLVWFVDKTDRLEPRSMEPVFYGQGQVFIPAPVDMDQPLRIAQSPNSGFTRGLLIQPIEKTEML